MAPEALLDAQTNDGKAKVKLARSSDVWSLGCILYQLVYGHAPFSTLNLYQKLHAITDPKHKIKFPPVPEVGNEKVDTSGWVMGDDVSERRNGFIHVFACLS